MILAYLGSLPVFQALRHSKAWQQQQNWNIRRKWKRDDDNTCHGSKDSLTPRKAVSHCKSQVSKNQTPRIQVLWTPRFWFSCNMTFFTQEKTKGGYCGAMWVGHVLLLCSGSCHWNLHVDGLAPWRGHVGSQAQSAIDDWPADTGTIRLTATSVGLTARLPFEVLRLWSPWAKGQGERGRRKNTLVNDTECRDIQWLVSPPFFP